MLVVIIPLKSKTVSKNWDLFCSLFERTLGSLAQQTDSNFQIIVVCHEKPEFQTKLQNIEYLNVYFNPPLLTSDNNDIHNVLKEEDKAKKIKQGINYASKYDVTQFMILDSDDCLRKDLVSYLNTKKTDFGWFINKGYIYKEGGKLVYLNSKNFHTLCGSTFIVKPELIHRMFIKTPHLRYAHEQIDPLSMGLKPLPFPGVVYSIGNGENHLMSLEAAKNYNTKFSTFSIDFFKSIYRKVAKYRIRIIDSKFRSRYGLDKIYY